MVVPAMATTSSSSGALATTATIRERGATAASK
jgi:hypothetical protein